MRKKVAILGSTGSIGRSAVDVVAHHGERFEVVGLAAGRRMEDLAQQVWRLEPTHVAVANAECAKQLDELLNGHPARPAIRIGSKGAAELVRECGAEVVLAGIVGAAGLLPTLEAVRCGATVGLANKEALVLAGSIMVNAARVHDAPLLPVDSEHNAIHQCLRAGATDEVHRVVLTASGGPFRGRARSQLQNVTPEEALCHPTWTMGPKITIDSATLMNKGLEVIEARWLFDLKPHSIDVMVHPQSIVHSMVEFRDGSTIAQLGVPDMRHPIQYALTWPDRVSGPVPRLDLARVGTLAFHEPDHDAFPCLGLAYRTLEAGGDAPARLNAANEVAVDAFLERRIGFLDIARTIEAVLGAEPVGRADDLDSVLDADRRAREIARRVIATEFSLS
ncbi:MAG: 1-deoxy-D-xylulose-5-phosphate reductoisomerase [Acidobacteria bacterium]|nr:1-deoxy-D-xylulose-5-phosphate reductoisomerase [Acidobacteriota bacterium]